MSRVIMIAVAVLVFFWLLRRALGSRKRGDHSRAAKSGPEAVPELVACAHCGVNLPKSEAVATPDEAGTAAARFYCGEEHRRLGPR